MTITDSEIESIQTPFQVIFDGTPKEKPIIVMGFSENDPLGVGGGLFPNMPTVYFESGGWLLLANLMTHYSIVERNNEKP